MPTTAFLWCSLLLTTVMTRVSAGVIPEPPTALEEAQDLYRLGLLETIQERDPKSLTYLKELALLLDKLKQQPMDTLSLQQQQALQSQNSQSEELLPIPLAMQGRPIPAMQENPREDKRTSYMSLCHFKICNMGRKRNYWNPWNRT